ncbi:hypothetical protein GOP47_0005909 [Adiantum capillus-veneris]|uniref:Uncharacterized protein n=1 Tax=Adiantum capillus-veneris TaxID=13818 RepID=A0A9D4V232_ADICA|nr:hypothetical protein GOP47_0005909 [Adiantum capillus-veneris]
MLYQKGFSRRYSNKDLKLIRCFQRQEEGRGCSIIKGGKGNNCIQGGDHSLIKGDHHLEEISIREEDRDLEDGRIQDPRGGEIGISSSGGRIGSHNHKDGISRFGIIKGGISNSQEGKCRSCQHHQRSQLKQTKSLEAV